MASRANPFGNASDGELGSWQPQIDDVDSVSMFLQPFKPPDEGLAGEGRLKGKALSLRLKVVQSLQHDAASFQGHAREEKPVTIHIDDEAAPERAIAVERRDHERIKALPERLQRPPIAVVVKPGSGHPRPHIAT